MMANGTSGDINNNNFLSPRPRMPPYAQIDFVANDLAHKVHAALASLSWQSEAELDAAFQELDVKWRSIPPELLEWANATAKLPSRIQGKTDLSAIYATRILKLAAASPQTKLPVQALRIGDICIGTSPCETFAETGIDFRKRSPFKHSFMVELAHGYYGYMPTPRHFELGGYETWPGTNNLEPEAANLLMQAVLSLAESLFGDREGRRSK